MPEKTRKEKNLIAKAKIILEIFMNATEHFNKTSVFYNQKTWLKQIKRCGGRDIGRRQLCRDFAGFRLMGVMQTYSRHRPDPIRGYEFRSTRVYIAEVGWRMAAHWGVISWQKAHKMIAAIKKGGQNKSTLKEYGVYNETPKTGLAQWSKDHWAKQREETREWINRLNNAPLPNE